MKKHLPHSTFNAAFARLYELYADGHTIVVSFSGGKDSTICLELAIMAATKADALPVHVIHRDEEILLPHTYEYIDRTYQRPEVKMRHVCAYQPVVNVFDRNQPYWWIFDDRVDPELWVRQPPSYIEKINIQNIEGLVTPDIYKTPPDKKIYSVIGLRVSESPNRRIGLFSSKGHLTKPNRFGVSYCRPIYDWSDGDVWKAIKDNKWDYNEAYNIMVRFGRTRRQLRIAPLTMTAAGIPDLQLASRAWPTFFDRVCARLGGVRLAANFGKRAVEPQRKTTETWEDCFWRECVNEAPQWISDRSKVAAEKIVNNHDRKNPTIPFPQSQPVRANPMGSWKNLSKAMYNGDPFVFKTKGLLPLIEPDEFRDGAGKWEGSPSYG